MQDLIKHWFVLYIEWNHARTPTWNHRVGFDAWYNGDWYYKSHASYNLAIPPFECHYTSSTTLPWVKSISMPTEDMSFLSQSSAWSSWLQSLFVFDSSPNGWVNCLGLLTIGWYCSLLYASPVLLLLENYSFVLRQCLVYGIIPIMVIGGYIPS